MHRGDGLECPLPIMQQEVMQPQCIPEYGTLSDFDGKRCELCACFFRDLMSLSKTQLF